ncbi:MAG: hypothetical protein II795_06455 [Firmicutes bacterium]|nr:hypothetical protein [Bacillota bacterium]
MYTQKDRREFGFVPGEFEYTPPDGMPAEGAGEIGPGAAVEFDQPSPEIIGPGEYVYEASVKKKRSAAKLAAMIAAVTLVLGASNPFVGPGDADPPAEEPRQEAEVPAGESSRYEKSQAAEESFADESAKEESAEISGPSGEENSAEESGMTPGTAESSTESSSGTESSETPAVYVEPDADVYLIAFYSEQFGSVEFRNMDNVTHVELQFYDTLTDSLDETRDITEEALTGVYEIEEFTTDFIYEKHLEEYTAAFSFPMEVRMDVVMTYDTADGEQTKVISTVSADESDHTWYLKYIPEFEEWEGAGTFMFEFMIPASEEVNIVYDPDYPPENIVPGTFVVTGELNREPLDIQSLSTMNSLEALSYDADGNETPITIVDLMVSKPAGVTETSGQYIHFTVTWYVESYGKPITIHKYVRATADYGE